MIVRVAVLRPAGPRPRRGHRGADAGDRPWRRARASRSATTTPCRREGSAIDGVEEALVERGVTDGRPRGEHQHHDVRRGHRRGERGDGSLSTRGRRREPHAGAHLVPGRAQPGRHRHAHVAEPDEADAAPARPRSASASRATRKVSIAPGRRSRRPPAGASPGSPPSEHLVAQGAAHVRCSSCGRLSAVSIARFSRLRVLRWQALAVPDRAPAIFRDELLHRAHERARPGRASGRRALARARRAASPARARTDPRNR